MPVSPLQSARVALPALAAASLTVAAAGTAVATDSVPDASASHDAKTNHLTVSTVKDTTQWTRDGSQVASRSSASRTAITKAKASAAAKAKARAAAAGKAKLAQDTAARKTALGAVDANDSAMTDFTQPTEEPSTPTPSATQSARSALATPSAASRDDERPAPTTRGWVRPLVGGTYTSGYGYRWGRMHNGNDFACPIGTPLRSMNDATVTAVGFYGGQGLRVNIRFENGTEAVYAHMSRASVSVGQRVAAGQRLGYSGNTGNSTGPHLHLEIHIGGQPINPQGWLAARGLI